MEVKGLKEQDLVTSKTKPPMLDSKPTLERPSQSERRPSSPVPSADEMDNIIQRITSVQLSLSSLTPDFLEKKNEDAKRYLVIFVAYVVSVINGLLVALNCILWVLKQDERLFLCASMNP